MMGNARSATLKSMRRKNSIKLAISIGWILPMTMVTKLIRAENKEIIACGFEGAQRFIK